MILACALAAAAPQLAAGQEPQRLDPELRAVRYGREPAPPVRPQSVRIRVEPGEYRVTVGTVHPLVCPPRCDAWVSPGAFDVGLEASAARRHLRVPILEDAVLRARTVNRAGDRDVGVGLLVASAVAAVLTVVLAGVAGADSRGGLFSAAGVVLTGLGGTVVVLLLGAVGGALAGYRDIPMIDVVAFP